MTAPWAVVVPVKRVATAKTRLAPVAGSRRDELAVALASDTVEAALTCPAVAAMIVVADDPAVAAVMLDLGADVVPDVPGAGLNPALEYGASVVRERFPDRPVAALSADLAALRPAELAAALAIAAGHDRSFVADAAGEGTTLLAALPRVPLRPAFGQHSAHRHRSSGAYEITNSNLDSLRLDIDTELDLRRARSLGLRRRTARIATAILESVQGV